MSDLHSDLVAQERAARVAWYLADGVRLTTREIAEYSDLQLRGAYYMMLKLARVLPIDLDEHGCWHRVDKPLIKRVMPSTR